MSADMLVRLATMNGSLLKELSMEEVLHIHPLLSREEMEFRVARKEKPIKAKPINTILNDDSVMAKIVLATLEGHETIKANSYVCWGIDNDVWQQTEKKLHDKYTAKHMDPDGWVHYEPKPEDINACLVQDQDFEFGPAGGWSVLNPSWGDERIIEGKQVYLQYGVVGDYCLQGLNDPNDLYRVAKKFFQNTYAWSA